MHRLAKINFNGATRLMPARSRYDRELVLEEAEFCARRHGTITLELGSAALLHVDHAPNSAQRACSGCAGPIGNLLFSTPHRALCRHCALKLS